MPIQKGIFIKEELLEMVKVLEPEMKKRKRRN
jgi:hypothetical protein